MDLLVGFVAKNSEFVIQWSKVCIPSDINCVLRALFYARVTLPTITRLNVVGFPPIEDAVSEVHDIAGTNVDALATSITL